MSVFGNIISLFGDINNYVWDTFNFSVNVYSMIFKNINNTSIFENLIISDGIHNAYKYFYEIFIVKFTQDTLDTKSKKTIIENYKKLYELDYIDRYLLYILVYITSIGIGYITNNETSVVHFLYISSFFISFPYIQNKIINIPSINGWIVSFIEKKNIFLYYSLSKTIIRFIQKLSPEIVDIQNLHIFVLYTQLTKDFLLEFAQTLLLIGFFNTIRQYKSTYYYYKAIKLSYYYNTGYVFNVTNKTDSIYLINTLIKKKQWNKLCKKEVINALYCLWANDFCASSHWTEINLITIRIFSAWSILSLFKKFSVVLNTYLLIFYISFLGIFNINSKKKYITLSFIIYTLILLNVNELVISIVFIKYNILYESFFDFVFFIANYTQLKKVLEFYSLKYT